MRILIITQRWYPDTFGGSENVAAEQARRLAERGHQVTVLTEYVQDYQPPEETIHNAPRSWASLSDDIAPPVSAVRPAAVAGLTPPRPPLTLRGGGVAGSLHLIRYGRPEQFQKWGSSLMDVKILPKLVRELHKKNEFDLAILHHPYPAYGFFKAGLRQGGAKIPALYIFHASTAREAEVEGLRRKFKGFLMLFRPFFVWCFIRVTRWVERKVLKQATKIAVFSEFSKQVLQEIYPLTPPSPARGEGEVGAEEKVLKIKSGIDTTGFFPAGDKAEAKEKLGFSPDRPIILTVRRLTARMGLFELLYASLRVREHFPQAKILIIGEGPMRDDIISEIGQLGLRGFTTLVGKVPLKDLPLYYQASDLFILPTAAFEGLGMATLEALASGLPVVGSPVGATPEILNKIDKLLVAKSAKADDLAEGMIDFLIRPIEERKELAKKCRAVVERDYDWGKAIVELEKIIINLNQTANSTRG